jgi:hypothetical protein
MLDGFAFTRCKVNLEELQSAGWLGSEEVCVLNTTQFPGNEASTSRRNKMLEPQLKPADCM